LSFIHFGGDQGVIINFSVLFLILLAFCRFGVMYLSVRSIENDSRVKSFFSTQAQFSNEKSQEFIWVLAKIKLFPAIVQGDEAPKSLIKALDLAYKDDTLDCLIIGRGGGSFEDLNCFNDESLARKLYEAPFPTISAVGHEGDYTICDFVCSFRAPTPTGAAMKLTKDKKDVNELIVNYSKRLSTGIKNKLVNGFNNWKSISSSYGLAKFDEIIDIKEQQLNDLNNRLNLLSPTVLAKKLNLPCDMTANALLAALKILISYEEYLKLVNRNKEDI
jgi:exodeoxyribonuclease VII large subunit